MKYKVGDRVKIKSLEWYNANKDVYDVIDCGDLLFGKLKSKYCGTVTTIRAVRDDYYLMKETGELSWTDEMIEGLAEEETTDNQEAPEQTQPAISAKDFVDMKLMEERVFTSSLGTTWKVTRFPGGVVVRETPVPSPAYVFIPLPDTTPEEEMLNYAPQEEKTTETVRDIHYTLRGETCLNHCPYSGRSGFLVGSGACQICHFNQHTNEEQRIVRCAAPVDGK